MKHLIPYLISVVFTFSLSTSLSAEENYRDLGNHRVYFSVFNSDFLDTQVAKLYGIKRSKSLALINITVTEKETLQVVSANISGSATNLIGQNRSLAFKEIKEADATYYIAQFRFTNEERFSFKIELRTPGSDETKSLTFSHIMYTTN